MFTWDEDGLYALLNTMFLLDFIFSLIFRISLFLSKIYFAVFVKCNELTKKKQLKCYASLFLIDIAMFILIESKCLRWNILFPEEHLEFKMELNKNRIFYSALACFSSMLTTIKWHMYVKLKCNICH